MLTVTKILLRHHIGAAQFWEMVRGTEFELGREGIPLGGESKRERVEKHNAPGGDARHRVHDRVPVETFSEVWSLYQSCFGRFAARDVGVRVPTSGRC
jgi:hypothetical protein